MYGGLKQETFLERCDFIHRRGEIRRRARHLGVEGTTANGRWEESGLSLGPMSVCLAYLSRPWVQLFGLERRARPQRRDFATPPAQRINAPTGDSVTQDRTAWNRSQD